MRIEPKCRLDGAPCSATPTSSNKTSCCYGLLPCTAPAICQLTSVLLAVKPEPLVSVPCNAPLKVDLSAENTNFNDRPSSAGVAAVKDLQTSPKKLVSPFTHDADFCVCTEAPPPLLVLLV